MLDAILGLQDTGTTVVIATHDPAVAARLSRRITLVDGRIGDPG